MNWIAFLAPVQSFAELPQKWRGDLVEWFHAYFPKLVVVVAVAFILMQLLRLVTNRLTRFSRAAELPSGVRGQQLRTLSGVLYSVGVFVIIFVALMQVLPLIGIDMGPLLASAGIAGLAIGFGAQTLVKDVLNGFFILLENQYDVGDTIKVAGVQGTVEAMTMRRTVLRDADGTLHTVPNSQVTIVSNLTRDWAQVTMHIPVAYEENSEKVTKLLQEVGTELRNNLEFSELIVADPQVPGIDRVSPGQVDYLMLVKTRPGAQYEVSRELRKRIRECFIKNNIRMANPQTFFLGSGGKPVEIT